jgi:CAAX protease family protein
MVTAPYLHYLGGPMSPGRILYHEVLGFGTVFGVALLMAHFERRAPAVYGLPAVGAFGKLFWQGIILGFVEISVLLGLIGALGGYSFGVLALQGTEILRWALIWAVIFVFVGLFEEFLFRGYTLYTLADGMRFWPAAVLLAGLFGAAHLMNAGEGIVGASSVFMIGMVFAFALKRTGNLWLVVGWHASFDFGETFLFSVPNSGGVFEGHLSQAALHGPAWLTGGTVGPEGSVFSFLTMAAAAVFIHFAFPAKKPAGETPAAAF